MRNWRGRLIITGIILFVDLYIFSVIRSVTANSSETVQFVSYISYWAVSLIALAFIFLFPVVRVFREHLFIRNYVFAILIGFFLAKIIASLFFLIDDLRRGSVWLLAEIFPGTGVDFTHAGGAILRSAIISWTGLLAGSSAFILLLYGFSNKYNYQVRHIKLAFDNLPAAFKGFKIVHISDIHSGSLQDKAAVNKGVDLILNEKPDLILFTGDLVNDHVREMTGFVDVFGRLKAPMGVFSTLGNHDYGDYYAWPDKDEKHRAAEIAAGKHLFTPMQLDSIEHLKEVEAKMGWRLLMNEHVALKKNEQEIALIGIENWGAKGHFPKYGKMDEAYEGTEKYPFKILMSHDPSHWQAEVKTKYPDVDLTLSGHTHGMQFGIELPRFKWSPVKWMYNEWAGLYESGKQKLYINRGFGFIGYPGRVGILPEITVIELV